METQDGTIPAEFKATLAVSKVSKGAFRGILSKLLRFIAFIDLAACKVDQFIF